LKSADYVEMMQLSDDQYLTYQSDQSDSIGDNSDPYGKTKSKFAQFL